MVGYMALDGVLVSHFLTEPTLKLNWLAQLRRLEDPILCPNLCCCCGDSTVSVLMCVSRYQRWDSMITRKKCRVPSIEDMIAWSTRPPTLTTPCSSVKGLRFLNSPFFIRLWKGFWATFIQNLSASASHSGVSGPLSRISLLLQALRELAVLLFGADRISLVVFSLLVFLFVQSHVLISSNLRTLMDRWPS